MSDIKGKLREIIAKEWLDESSITDETILFDSGILDSLSVLRLINFIETEFGITVGRYDVTLENFGDLNRIEAFVRNKRVFGLSAELTGLVPILGLSEIPER